MRKNNIKSHSHQDENDDATLASHLKKLKSQNSIFPLSHKEKDVDLHSRLTSVVASQEQGP